MHLSGKLAVCFILSLVIAVSSCKSEPSPEEKADPVSWGKSIYSDYCKLCHGADGTLQLNGAANLAASQLSKEETINVITNGRNAMQPFKSILSEEEIEAVTEYILTLRK